MQVLSILARAGTLSIALLFFMGLYSAISLGCYYAYTILRCLSPNNSTAGEGSEGNVASQMQPLMSIIILSSTK